MKFLKFSEVYSIIIMAGNMAACRKENLVLEKELRILQTDPLVEGRENGFGTGFSKLKAKAL